MAADEPPPGREKGHRVSPPRRRATARRNSSFWEDRRRRKGMTLSLIFEYSVPIHVHAPLLSLDDGLQQVGHKD
jgi:hypothetical protein